MNAAPASPAATPAETFAPFPLRAALGVALGFLVAAAAFHLLPHDPTAPLNPITAAADPLAAHPELLQKKQPGERRILFVGASLSYGYPFGPQASYARVLEECLRAVFPGERILVKALAKPAIESSRLAEMVDAALAAEPDCVWIDLGGNELGARLFFGRELVPTDWLGRLGDHGTRSRELFASLVPKATQTAAFAGEEAIGPLLLRLLEARPAKPLMSGLPVSTADRAALAARLRQHLRGMASAVRSKNADVTFMVSPYDLAGGWPRGMTEQRADVDAAVLAYHRGERAPRATVAALAERYPDRADVQFLFGRRLLELGELAAADVALRRARDLDPAPLHLVGAIEATVRSEAAALDVPVLEPAAAALLPGSTIPDPACYLDPSHWTLEGNLHGARYLAEHLSARGLLPPLPATWRATFEAAGKAYLDAAIDQAARARAAAEMQRATGVYHMLFGNPREGLLPLTDGVAWFASILEGPQTTMWFDWSIRVLWCAAVVAGRDAELLSGAPAQRDARVLALGAALWRAARSGDARRLVLRIVDGESFAAISGG
jgi:hypothetical protein